MDLLERYEAAMASPSPDIETHQGFNMNTVCAMTKAKYDPTAENLAAARKAIQDQIDGVDPYEFE
jgi:hypothetical protein